MKIVILAGGFGTRLRSVVQDLPKPMAPVGDRFFLEYVIMELKSQGLNDFIFCVHYKADKIIDYFGDGSKFGVSITYSVEETPLGTGGAIGLLRNNLKETFGVVNGDTFLKLDVNKFLTIHQQSKVCVTMAAYGVSDYSRYGKLVLDQKNNVISFVEKNNLGDKEGFINAGFYLVEPKIFKFIKSNKIISLEKDVFPELIEKSLGIQCFPYVKQFIDIGIPEDYEKFKNLSIYL